MYTYICLSFRTKYNFQSHLLLTDGFIPANKEKGMVYLSSEFLFLILYIFFFAASIYLFVSIIATVFCLLLCNCIRVNVNQFSFLYKLPEHFLMVFEHYVQLLHKRYNKSTLLHERMYLKIFKTVIIDHIFVLIKTHQNI